MHSALCIVLAVGAPFFEEFGHILGDWAFEIHVLASAWMAESQRAGMECLERACLKTILYKLLIFCKCGAFQDFIASVAGIVEEGMSLGEHMDANLMCAPGLQHAFHACDISESLHNFIVGDCMLPNLRIFKHCHLKFIARIASDIAYNSAAVGIEITPYQRDIFSAGRLVEELES